MIGYCFKGDVKDVCAEIKAEAERYKGKSFGAWLRQRKLEESMAKDFGITVEEFRLLCGEKEGV